MHSIAEKHFECVTRRIDPERSSGKTRVTKRAERKQIAFVCRVTRGNVPAEAAGAIFTGSSWLGHRGDREGAENPRALIGSAAQDHLTRSEEHTSELQSLRHLVCRLLLEKKKT